MIHVDQKPLGGKVSIVAMMLMTPPESHRCKFHTFVEANFIGFLYFFLGYRGGHTLPDEDEDLKSCPRSSKISLILSAIC